MHASSRRPLLLFISATFGGLFVPSSAARAQKFCTAYPDFRDKTLIAAYDHADALYKIQNDHVAMLLQFRQQLGNDLAFDGSDGRLAFGQFAQATKVNSALLLNLLAFTEEAEVATAKSLVLASIEAFETSKAIADKPIDFAVIVAAKENPAGKALKAVYDVYDGVREIADLGDKREEYIKTAGEQLDALDNALIAAYSKRGTYATRLDWINQIKTEMDVAYTQNCASLRNRGARVHKDRPSDRANVRGGRPVTTRRFRGAS